MTAEPAYAEAIEREKERPQEDMNQRLHMEPPWQLKLTAVLVLWFGIGGVWGMISSLISGDGLSVNFNALYILGAFGLLRRSRRSIFWVKWPVRIVSIVVTGILAVILFRWLVFGDSLASQVGATSEQWPPIVPTTYVHLPLAIALFFWPAVSFSLPPVRDFLAFPELPRNLPGTRAWLGVAAAVLTPLAMQSDWRENEVRFVTENTFEANVRIAVTDAETGKPLGMIQAKRTLLPGQWFEVSRQRGETWEVESDNAVSRDNSLEGMLVVKGKVLKSLRLQIGVPEYEPQDITIDKTTPPELVVKLKPVKP